MTKLRLMSVLAVFLALNTFQVHAAIQYQFTSTSGQSIIGSFIYDPTAPAVINDGGVPGTFYGGAITNLQGSWQGHQFSDASGYGGVWNDTLNDVGAHNVDLVQLAVDPPSGGNLVGFQTDFNGMTYQLTNIRIFWIEDQLGGASDFVDTELLPMTLPPTDNLLAARIALDFVAINDPANTHIVFGYSLQVTPVPLPPSLWLMLASLGGLAVSKRRKK